MILGIFVVLAALMLVFGSMLFGFMWLMEYLKKREDDKRDRDTKSRLP